MATVQATTDTRETSRLISAEKVGGTPVENPQGESLGHINDVMIDKVSGTAWGDKCPGCSPLPFITPRPNPLPAPASDMFTSPLVMTWASPLLGIPMLASAAT